MNKKVISAMLAASMAVSLAACGSTATSEAASSEASSAVSSETTGTAASGESAASGSYTGTPIKVGGIGPITGAAATYGNAVKNAEELAVKEINAANGSDVFDWKFEDDEHDAEKSVNAYNSLKDWGMQVLAGPVTTTPTLAVAAESVNDNMFVLTPSASAQTVIETGDNVFQICFTDPNQGVASADYIAENALATKIGVIYDSSDAYSSGIYAKFKTEAESKGLEIVTAEAFTSDNKSDLSTQVAKCQEAGAELVSTKFAGSKVGIIYDSSDDYSSGLYKGFSEKAAELGVEVVATTSFTADNKADLSTQVTQCKDAGADLVFLPIYYTEASQILTTANKTGYEPIFFGCDGMDGILDVEGFDTSLAEGLMLLTPFAADAQDEKTQAFVSAYVAAYGETPNQFAADAYDVIYSMYQAVLETGITGDMDASEICEQLKTAYTSMTFDGLTGTGMTWDASGAVSKAPKAVVIKDGAYAAM